MCGGNDGFRKWETEFLITVLFIETWWNITKRQSWNRQLLQYLDNNLVKMLDSYLLR